MKKSNFLFPKKDIGTPINFIPVPSPHLSKITTKFSKQHTLPENFANFDFPNKIKEVDEDELIGSKNSGNEKLEYSKKNIFEEFLVIGIDKKDFMNSKIDEFAEGFTPAKIIYHYENEDKKDQDWFVNINS